MPTIEPLAMTLKGNTFKKGPQPSEQPRTAAGRALLDYVSDWLQDGQDDAEMSALVVGILAIEAEAAAPAESAERCYMPGCEELPEDHYHPAPSQAIDGSLLAQALAIVAPKAGAPVMEPDFWRNAAEEIAAEYARLEGQFAGDAHGPYGNEGYCRCGTFVGHSGDWTGHR